MLHMLLLEDLRDARSESRCNPDANPGHIFMEEGHLQRMAEDCDCPGFQQSQISQHLFQIRTPELVIIGIYHVYLWLAYLDFSPVSPWPLPHTLSHISVFFIPWARQSRLWGPSNAFGILMSTSVIPPTLGTFQSRSCAHPCVCVKMVSASVIDQSCPHPTRIGPHSVPCCGHS